MESQTHKKKISKGKILDVGLLIFMMMVITANIFLSIYNWSSAHERKKNLAVVERQKSELILEMKQQNDYKELLQSKIEIDDKNIIISELKTEINLHQVLIGVGIVFGFLGIVQLIFSRIDL